MDTKILNWKNIIWLSLISYGLYIVLWIVIENRIIELWREGGFWLELGIDFVLCLLFIVFSLLYSHMIFRHVLPSRRSRPYARLLLYACLLFLLNNAMAYAMSTLCDMIWGDVSDALFRQQNIYTYGMVATFVSCIYFNAVYLETCMKTEDEKQRLDNALLKQQKIALQSQLDMLKSQIDTHFMFNNFSILAELIEEDRVLAGKFLANLSKVYRYVIQNMKRHKIPVSDETTFLDAYLYLIEMRYEGAVVVNIGHDVRIADGSIPPACLQLLVENAIKHNRHSAEEPLRIDICREGDYISVSNPVAPLLSGAGSSTGIGQKNIAERYSLLSDRQMVISSSNRRYTVKLPILEN